jgi:hypothetical protein
MARLRTLLLAFVLLAAPGLSGPVVAQQAQTAEEQQLNAIVGSPAFRTFLQDALIRNEPRALKAACADIQLSRIIGFIIVAPLNLTQRGIEAGAWITAVAVDRCGTPATRRIMARVEGGPNSLTATGMLPGDFRGDLQLETDILRVAIPRLMAAANCVEIARFGVADIRQIAPATPAAWSETWFADACDKKVVAVVEYVQTATGVTYGIRDIKLQ